MPLFMSYPEIATDLTGFDPAFYKRFRSVSRPWFDVVIDISVENPHLVPGEGPAILVSNHKSDMDPFLLIANIKRPIHWFAGSYLYNIPVWGEIMKKLGAIPVSKDPAEIKEAFRTAVEILKAGGLVGVFPEGWEYISEGRFTAPVGRFQTGFVRLAIQNNAPVVPMAVVGIRARAEAQALPPFMRKLLNFPFELQYNPSRLQFEKVHVIVGHPLHVPQPEGKPSHEFLSEWAETARSAVVSLETRVVNRRLLTHDEGKGRVQDEMNPLSDRLQYFFDRLGENPGELRGQLEYQAGASVTQAMKGLAQRMAAQARQPIEGEEGHDNLEDLLHAALVSGWLSRMEVELEMPRHPVADPGTRHERDHLHHLLLRLMKPVVEPAEPAADTMAPVITEPG